MSVFIIPAKFMSVFIILAKFANGHLCPFYNSGQILLGEIILILAKLMCNLEKIFAFFIVTRWYKMYINAILDHEFISKYPVKSYKIALFVIKCW
jgi:hypothetical protein